MGKNFVEEKIEAELDNALEALLCLFSDHSADTSESGINAVAATFKEHADEIDRLMEAAEKAVVQEIAKASVINANVHTPRGTQKTDAEVMNLGQCRRRPSINAKVDATWATPGSFARDDAARIERLATSISLSASCATEIAKAYSHLLAKASAENEMEAKIMNPKSIASLMVRIRKQQLFDHFTVYEENGEKISDAIKFVKEMFHAELEEIDIVVASCLTKLLDWTYISRLASKYVSGKIPLIMAREIEEQLDPVRNGNAACSLVLKIFQTVYTTTSAEDGSALFNKFDLIYRKDPMQAFVDCGIIDSEMKRNPLTKAIVTAVVDGQRTSDGSLTPQTLITAMRSICIPTSLGTPGISEDQTGIITYYLWFEGLQLILKNLGFSDEEMEKAWLWRQWMIITENKGLFCYRDISEINRVLSALTGGGLWKAAMKALLLYVRIGGFVCCDLGKMKLEECGERAREIGDADQEDYQRIATLCQWPEYVEIIWERHAEVVDLHKGTLKVGPKFLKVANIENFVEALLYLPIDEDYARTMEFTPLNAHPTNDMDLQWHYGPDRSVWNLMDKKTPKRLRGMWLEIFMDICSLMDCLPSDVDIYYQCLEWQSKNRKGIETVPWIRLEVLKVWLHSMYVNDLTCCTESQFNTLMNVHLGIDIDAAILTSQIFNKCPKIEGDDQGELRRLSDLGFAFSIWLGHGLWRQGVVALVDRLVPRGNMRNLALAALPDAFGKVDTEGNGILQPGQALRVLRQVLNPGLTEKSLKDFLETELQLGMIQPAELHKYFTMMDINGDGVLTMEEFLPTIRFLVIGFFPTHVCRAMNLTSAQIFKFVVTVVLNLVGLFIFITLVIQTFTSGTGVASVMHSGLSAFGGLMSKFQSDGNSGAVADVVAAATFVENKVRDKIIATLGLKKAVVEKLTEVSKSHK